MKKILLATCMFALAACGSSNKPATEPPQPPVAVEEVPTDQQAVLGNWTFTAPASFKRKDFKEDNAVAFMTEDKTLIIAGSIQSFEGTVEDVVQEKVGIFTDKYGMDILGSKNFVIEGNNAVLLAAKNNKGFVLSLSLVENGSVVSLTCGGLLNAKMKESMQVCAHSFASLKHKK